jgi:hypothetical protein
MRRASLAVACTIVLFCSACTATESGKKPGLWVAMYPVNRLLDVADIVSLGVGIEPGVYLDVHATRLAQLGGGFGGGTEVGWWPHRELGLRAGSISGLHIGPWSGAKMTFSRVGTRGQESLEYQLLGINTPGAPIFQEQVDYLGIGARIMMLVGLNFELHPVEVLDAVLGFAFIDFKEDDIGNRPAPEVQNE